MRLRLLMDDGVTEVTCPADVRSYYGKHLIIEDDHCELRLEVDFDDVNHDDVVNEALHLIKIVNDAEESNE